MDEFDRELEEAGRRLSPDLNDAHRATLDRAAGGSLVGGRVSLRNRAAAVVAGIAVAAALATLLTVSITHRTGSSTSNGASGVAGVQPAQVGAGNGVASSQSISNEGTATAQGTATIPSPGVVTGTPAPATILSPKSVNESNDGADVVLHVGQELQVTLSGGGLHWSEPRASNSGVLTQVSGQTSADGGASAVFRAASVGQAMVVSAGNPACAPRCGIPSRAYELTVTVVA
jgi:hypothetical protein